MRFMRGVGSGGKRGEEEAKLIGPGREARAGGYSDSRDPSGEARVRSYARVDLNKACLRNHYQHLHPFGGRIYDDFEP